MRAPCVPRVPGGRAAPRRRPARPGAPGEEPAPVASSAVVGGVRSVEARDDVGSDGRPALRAPSAGRLAGEEADVESTTRRPARARRSPSPGPRRPPSSVTRARLDRDPAARDRAAPIRILSPLSDDPHPGVIPDGESGAMTETLAARPVDPDVDAETRAGFTDSAEGWVPPSWDDVVREHADRVYRLAYRLTGDAHDAEDLTQETFIRVFRSLAAYQPGTFEGWLHRITTNLFLDMVRRRGRLRMEGLPEDTDRLPGGGPDPEQVFSEAHLDPDLQGALDELAPEFRAAVVLCDVEGLSYEEIAATLGVKLGTVRSRIHRGRQSLRAGLESRAADRVAAVPVGTAS